MRLRRTTWLVGGVGLIAAGIAGVMRNSAMGLPVTVNVLTLLFDLLWAAAILTLAWGLSRDGSVVARGPLGVIGMSVVAVWPLVASLVDLAVHPQNADLAGWGTWTYVSLIVPTAAALVAVAQIARAGVVPPPWNWAPTWVLIGQALVWIAPQLVFATAVSTVQGVSFFNALGSLCFLAGTVGLGIVATILATRSRETITVFRSGPPA